MKNKNLIKLYLENLSDEPNIHFSHFEKLLDAILSLYLFKAKNKIDYFKNERLYYIDLLVQKFMLHGFSVKKLISGIQLDSPSQQLKISILDPFSIYTLIRTMIETFLVQNYLSNITQGEDLLNGRFEIWMRYGLLKRGNNFTISEVKEVLESDKKNIEQLEESIKKRAFYRTLSEERKSKFLKSINSEWKFIFDGDRFYPVSWKKLLEESGINTFICNETYNFLSWHAHSQSISILQLKDMWENDNDKISIRNSIKQLNMYIAFMASDAILSDENFRQAYESLNENTRELINFLNFNFRDKKYFID